MAMCGHGKGAPVNCCAEGAIKGGGTDFRACRCGGNLPRHLVLPAILHLLEEEPSHGYALQQKLSRLGILDSGASPATIYRVLSRLEEGGLAEHDHSDEGQGPTRKVYRLTEEGRAVLQVWRSHLRKTRDLLNQLVTGEVGK
jgi:DNA-binding PadR family transcriptional regulator